MSLGDLLNGADRWIDQRIESIFPAYGDKLKEDQARLAQQQEHPTFFKQWADANARDAGTLMAPIDTGIRKIGLGPMLDLPSRSWDTLFITAAHASGGVGQGPNWGEFFDRDSWDRAWDSWAKPEHVTAGTIIAARLNARTDSADARAIYGADPLDAANAKAIQDAADNTWYGSALGAAADLTASMVVPGLGTAAKLAKAARSTRVVQSSLHAEEIAQYFAASGTAAKGSRHMLRNAAVAVSGVPQGGGVERLIGRVGIDADPASYVTAMQKFAQSTEGMDRIDLMNHLGPMLEHTDDAGKAIIANLWADVNKFVDDATLRDQVKINTLLALQGSKTAREAVIADAPLVAANMYAVTGSPKAVAFAQELKAMRLGDGESTINALLEKHFSTTAHFAEIEALRDVLAKAEADAKAARELRNLIRANKPTLKGFDSARLQETRQMSLENTRRISAELKQARADLNGSKRWATAAYKRGELTDVRDFSINLGEKRQRVADLETELAQARADRDLFHSTPLPGFEQLGQWRANMAEVRGTAKEADANVRWNQALIRQQMQAVDAKRAARAELSPTLNAANTRLTEVFSLGTDELMTGRIAPTVLDKVKAHLRDQIGDEYYFNTGDGNPVLRAIQLPLRAARIALAPRARGSVSLVEPALGYRQLEDALRRSGVYSPREIRQAANDFIAAPTLGRGSVVNMHQERMLQGIAQKFAPKDLSPEEALTWAKEFTGETIRHYNQGHSWTTKALDEQVGKGRIMVRDPESGDVIAVFQEGLLRTELRDSAPFLDPAHFEEAIRLHLPGNTITKAKGNIRSFNEYFTMVWKHGALLRPGLAVRASLDTQLRSWALVSTAEALTNAIVGASHLAHNMDTRAIERVMFQLGKDPGTDAVKLMSMDFVPTYVKAGKGKRVRFQSSWAAAQREANMQAAAKGGSITSSLQPHVQKKLGKYLVDRTRWDKYAANSPNWEIAHIEYSQIVAGSPVGRRLAEFKFKDGSAADGSKIVEQLRRDPEVMGEYRQIAQPTGKSFDEFVHHAAHEVDNMFPTRQVWDRARNGRLSVAYLKKAFPKETRFDVPGPHMSALQQPPFVQLINKSLASMYKTFLDKPDMWMSRNPTLATIYRREVRREAADMLKRKHGADLTPEDISMIDRRAHLTAISDVRRTFFDTTRWNGAHEKVARLMPFFAAWEDAMTSWARLIYDDPRRLAKLSAGYNAAGTLNPWMPEPLLINENGVPVKRGEHPEQAFIAVPFPVGPKGKMRWRLEALNSIAQGQVWWQPGFGPQATMATTLLFGKVIPHDVALQIVGTDNPLGKSLLKSMYLDGEIPKYDTGTMVLSALPGYVRTVARDIFGENMARNAQVGFNKRVADATARGDSITQKDLRRFMKEAAHDAEVAGMIRLISSAGFGMTGTAVVDGQFYVDRIHEIEAMSPEALRQTGFSSPEEYFTHLYPEAGELEWHMSKNVRGISATVNAQTSASKQRAIMEDYLPEVGWMVVGSDNLGGPFSRTAYNEQMSEGDRRKVSFEEMSSTAQAAVGWKRYNNFMIDLKTQAEQLGISMQSDAVDAVKRAYRQALMAENSEWAKDFNTSENKSGPDGIYWNEAQKMANDPRLRNRPDMVAFRDYVAARQQVLDYYQIKSLSGTSPERVEARKIMNALGEQLSAQNLGFMQMWNRFLSRETEEK